MKKYFRIGIFILIIVILALIVILARNTDISQVDEYIPEQEITEEGLRQTAVNLYFQNKETKELDKEARMIDSKILLKEPYKELILLLIEGPKNEKLEGTIPKETKINNVSLENGIVKIDFSKEFVENHIDDVLTKENTVKSIVNTLTELTEVNGIKILIDGDENASFNDETITFSEEFYRK